MIRRTPRTPASSMYGVALALVLVLVGCSLPSDGQPRPIAEEAIPDALESAGAVVPATAATGRTEDIFVVRTVATDDGTDVKTLTPFPIELDGEPKTKDLLEALLLAQPGAIDEQLSTAIPDELEIDLNFDGSTAIISLSDEFENVEGIPQQLAVAQLVYTATELRTVDAVEFRKIGSDEPLVVPTDDGTTAERVDRDDFEEFAPDVTGKK